MRTVAGASFYCNSYVPPKVLETAGDEEIQAPGTERSTTGNIGPDVTGNNHKNASSHVAQYFREEKPKPSK
jgi:hypothetical protein